MVSVSVRRLIRFVPININIYKISVQKAKGIASGLLFLHEKDVIHSDMKSVRYINEIETNQIDRTECFVRTIFLSLRTESLFWQILEFRT